MTNQLTVDQLVKAVEQWSIDKGLHNGNSFTQFAKSSEEMGKSQRHYVETTQTLSETV